MSDERALSAQIAGLVASLEAGGRSVLIHHSQELLQSIVEAAAQIFGAAAASMALVDETEQRLVFEVACGIGKENVIGLSVPLDQGIAGYVVMTGQPISVSDVRKDARFNQGFASSTGYVPQAILATPLLVDDQVIGVMEVLDKIDAASFGMHDMELLGVFARQAAIAIHQAQQYERLEAALLAGLRRIAAEDGSAELLRALSDTSTATPSDELLQIADQFNALSRLGAAEQRVCLDVLQAFGRYARARTVRY